MPVLFMVAVIHKMSLLVHTAMALQLLLLVVSEIIVLSINVYQLKVSSQAIFAASNM